MLLTVYALYTIMNKTGPEDVLIKKKELRELGLSTPQIRLR